MPLKLAVRPKVEVLVLKVAKPPPLVLMFPLKRMCPSGLVASSEELLPPMTVSFTMYHPVLFPLRMVFFSMGASYQHQFHQHQPSRPD